ncbi:Pup--protein ligase [Devriesea agamarum]|uniref:Pup--protein ligase n=1 Tax=Devriesea agamarum TaxID=472569 RepID=UPI00071D629D|nr:Pup--protein ligase [Devriesea agamarum]
MERRVFGLETEYGLVCVREDGTRAVEPEDAAREMFRPVVAWGRSSNVFLPNAARLYVDVGSHPEYATAECDDVLDLVAQDRAGEQIMSDLVSQANARLAARGQDARLHLFKNNVDSEGNGYGSHENYLVSRRGEFTRLPRVLLPFLITRQIVAGAGGVVTDPDGPRFVFSRRSDHMWEAVSSATTRTRPIINTRDEPHGDPTRFRRLHVIVGDSTMSELSTMLRVGTCDLVLRLIESGRAVPDLELADPIRSIRQVARDLSGSTPLPLATGGSSSPLAIQQTYLDACAAAFPDADPELMNLWQTALDAVATGDHSRVATQLDWAIKKNLFDRVCERRGVPLDDAEIHRLELAYHDISAADGIFDRLRKRGLAPSVISQNRVQEAMQTAPGSTRAHLRGRFVTEALARGVDHVADWTTLRLNHPGARPVTLLDPFQTESKDVDRLVDEIHSSHPDNRNPGFPF